MTKKELQELAERLAGGTRVVDAEQLRLAGADKTVVRAMLGVEWQSDVRGVYVIDALPVDDVCRAHIAAHVGGRGSVISGWLALHWLKLPWVPALPTILVLVGADTRKTSRGSVYVRRTKALPELQTWEHEGLAVAPAAQAVVDTTRQISMRKDWSDAWKLRQARGVVLGAVAKRACTGQELLAVLGAGAVAHSKLARRVCVDVERGVVSPPEAEIADGAMAFGVPFVCNVEVWVDGVFRGIVDGYLIGTGVSWEGDSEERHAGEALSPTLRRWRGIERAGISQEHVTPKDFRNDPAAFWHALFGEVRRRRALGLGDPPGLELRNARGPVLCGESTSPPYTVDLSRCVLPTQGEPPVAA